MEKNSFELLSKFHDKSGCVLITEVKIKNEVLLFNLYNVNMENEQLSKKEKYCTVLKKKSRY